MSDVPGAASALDDVPPPAGSAHSGPPRGRWPLSHRATIATGAGVLAVVVAAGATAYALWPDGGDADKTVALAPTEDTFVNAATPAKVNGDQTKLVAASEAAGAKTIYLMFELPELPEGKVATSAKLMLTRESGKFPATTVQAHEVTATNWSQKTLNAKTAPEPGAVASEATVAAGGNSVVIGLGNLAAGRKYALALTSPVTDSVVRFKSVEAGEGAPRLIYRTATGSVSAAPRPGVPQPSAPDSDAPSAGTQPGQTGAPADPGGAGCTVSAILVPSCGRWFGAAPQAHTKGPRVLALANFEQRLGAPVDIMHVYHNASQLFPNESEVKMATEPGKNRYLLVNWKPSGKWADIAAGQSDPQIDRLAAHITSTFRGKFFLAIYHEPENEVRDAAGSGMRAVDYKAMYRHVVQRLREKGVTNAVMVMNYMGAIKHGVEPWFGDLYPGDDVVDWVAFDPYAVGEPGFNDGDFAKMVNRGQGARWPGMYDYLVKHHAGKPIMLGEWGFGDYAADPSAKPEFFADMVAQLARFPAIKALVYFDAPDASPFGDTRIDSSKEALAAFRKLSGDPVVARAPAPKVAP